MALSQLRKVIQAAKECDALQILEQLCHATFCKPKKASQVFANRLTSIL